MTAAGVRDAADIERALTAFAREPNGGLIVTPNPLTIDQTRPDHRVGCPAAVCRRSIRSVSFPQMAAWSPMDSNRIEPVRAGRILRRPHPARGESRPTLPVQLPTKYELVINLKTAKALGLDDPAVAAGARGRGDWVAHPTMPAPGRKPTAASDRYRPGAAGRGRRGISR